MNYSPADILAQYLIDEEIVIETPSEADDEEFTITVGSMPDDGNWAVCVYNTTGIPDGRIQRTGEKIEHPGIQVRVRAPSDPVCFDKAKSIADALDAIINAAVEMEDGTDYVIQSVTRPSPIISLGEENGRRRFIYTINAILTIGE